MLCDETKLWFARPCQEPTQWVRAEDELWREIFSEVDKDSTLPRRAWMDSFSLSSSSASSPFLIRAAGNALPRTTQRRH